MCYIEDLGIVEYDILCYLVCEILLVNFYIQFGICSNEWIVLEGQYFVLGDN